MFKLITILAMLFPGGGKDTAYVKYEKEKVGDFRFVPDFEPPMVSNFIAPSSNEGDREVQMLPDDSLGLYLDEPNELGVYASSFRKKHCDIVKGPGFRIQIYAGGDLQNANKIRADFLEVYEKTSIHLDWVSPTFKVRAGDFLTRREAMSHLADIRQLFPDAFIVSDQVLYPKYREIKYDPDSEEDNGDILDNN